MDTTDWPIDRCSKKKKDAGGRESLTPTPCELGTRTKQDNMCPSDWHLFLHMYVHYCSPADMSGKSRLARLEASPTRTLVHLGVISIACVTWVLRVVLQTRPANRDLANIRSRVEGGRPRLESSDPSEHTGNEQARASAGRTTWTRQPQVRQKSWEYETAMEGLY